MEVAVPCTICKLLSTCDCKLVLTSYVGLLERVHKRVLSTKAASIVPLLPTTSAGIDKLDIQFQTPLEIAKILEKSRSLGYDSKIVKLRSKRPYLRITYDKIQIHLTLDFYRQYITGLVSNPNRFGSWTSYINFLEQLFTKQTLQTSKIQRLDLNLDFALSFSDLIQQIDVKNKSTASKFDDKGGKHTGLYIGKNPELVAIYDKSKKSKSKSLGSRMEVRLGGPKLKIKSIYDIPEQLRIRDFFPNIIGTHLNFNETGLSKVQKERLHEFTSILKRDGLYSARKHMNQERNFGRDFAKILKMQSWGQNPTDLFKQGIERFLRPLKSSIKLIQ